jgi:CheY-like chemotaxis protein
MEAFSSPSLRILVVDDCPDNRGTLRTLVRLWGHQAYEAADGFAALKAAEVFLPDVILLDIILPGLNGFEVARQLRALPALARTMLVAVTGHARRHEAYDTSGGVFDFRLVKPFDPGVLEQLLKSRAGACSTNQFSDATTCPCLDRSSIADVRP